MNNKIISQSLSAFRIVLISSLTIFTLYTVQAWVSPTLSAPNGNVGGPLTTATTTQVKTGSLGLLDNLSIGKDLIINGTTTTNVLRILTGAGANKVLTSDANGNASWATSTNGIPTGGTTGQVITKQIDGSAAWQSPTGGMVILLTDAQKIAYYSGHGVALPSGAQVVFGTTSYWSHACKSSIVGGNGCTYYVKIDAVIQNLEARSDGYIYLTHVPSSGSDCGGWQLCGLSYADYRIYNYLTNNDIASDLYNNYAPIGSILGLAKGGGTGNVLITLGAGKVSPAGIAGIAWSY